MTPFARSIRRRLGHAPRAARRTDAAPLATERDERVARAAVAGQAQESMGKDAALEIGVELVFDEVRQAGSVDMRYLGGEGRVVLPHQPIQRCLFRAAAFVTGCAGGGCALGGCAHEAIGV